MSQRFVPLPPEIADLLRARPRGDGAAALVTADERPGFPCRVCLEDAAAGETVILTSYSPFAAPAPYRTEGPIFVHERSCAPHPPAREPPPVLRERLLSVRAHDAAAWLLRADVCEGAALPALLARFFDDPRVSEAHVHFARTGCFACRVTRGPA